MSFRYCEQCPLINTNLSIKQTSYLSHFCVPFIFSYYIANLFINIQCHQWLILLPQITFPSVFFFILGHTFLPDQSVLSIMETQYTYFFFPGNK